MNDLDDLKMTIDSALKKLKGGMDDGPFAPDVPLTTAECTVVYRILNERIGLEAPR